MMVGEERRARDVRCRPARTVAKNFSGSPMPAKASTLRALQRRHRGGVRAPAGRETPAGRAGLRNDIARAHVVADDQQRIAALELRVERRAQRTGRKHASIADAAPAIDDGDGEVLGQRGILQAVIHDDDAGASALCASAAPATRLRATTSAPRAPAAALHRRPRCRVGRAASTSAGRVLVAAIAARQAERRFRRPRAASSRASWRSASCRRRRA